MFGLGRGLRSAGEAVRLRCAVHQRPAFKDAGSSRTRGLFGTFVRGYMWWLKGHRLERLCGCVQHNSRDAMSDRFGQSALRTSVCPPNAGQPVPTHSARILFVDYHSPVKHAEQHTSEGQTGSKNTRRTFVCPPSAASPHTRGMEG
jgi:hypothetical protein